MVGRGAAQHKWRRVSSEPFPNVISIKKVHLIIVCNVPPYHFLLTEFGACTHVYICMGWGWLEGDLATHFPTRYFVSFYIFVIVVSWVRTINKGRLTQDVQV